MPLTSPDIPVQALVKRFALIYLTVAIPLSLLLLLGIRFDGQYRLKTTEISEESRIEVAKGRVVGDLAAVDTDLRVIANLPVLRRYLDSGDPVQHEELENIFLDLARETRRYDQIRYLDAGGQEIVRINYNDGRPVIVPHGQLQNKSGRYYFADTIKLNRGETFVSPLDLNIEHGELEIPYKPMLRYGTPVFDSAGHKKGIILFNYFGNELLQNFRAVMRGGNTHISMLLNRDGYWLQSDNREEEWGFMLGKSERTFARDFPEAWRAISAAAHGSLLTEQGLFTYTTVFPLLGKQHSSTGSVLAYAHSQKEVMAQEYYWKIVTFVPHAAISGDALYNQPLGRIEIVTVYLLLALAAYLVALVVLNRKQAQVALRDSATRIRTILDHVADGIITINGHGIIETYNPAAERLFGYAAAEAAGQNVSMLMPEPYRSEHDDYIERYSATGEAHVIGTVREAVGQHKSGDTFPIELGISEMQLGDQLFFTGIVRDISVRKQAEEMLEQAKEKAEKANRAKDSFLTTMSHEIRTPLTGLLGMLEMLSLTPLNSKQNQTLQIAWNSGRSLLRIVSDILDWTKIEEGKLELSLHSTSIRQLLQEVVNTYSGVASAKGLMLTQHADVRLSSAHIVDPFRLSQVLNNFVSNAIKFTQHGEIELRAEFIEPLNSSERIRFSVKDSGVGIAKDVQQHIFQRYRQEDVDVARMYGGTGLGLAICRRLAELMDGQIDLTSEPGLGSTFSITLTLPVSDTPWETVQAQNPEVKQRKVTPLFDNSADAPLVLAVEDHPINRELLEQQIRLLGLRAETAENGRAALTMWREGRFALVITDCHMPQMDGYALSGAIRRIEAEEKLPRTPIIAWTANAIVEELERCRAAGMDEVLVKPTNLPQLKRTLAKQLAIPETDSGTHASSLHDPDNRQAAGPIDFSELEKIVPDKARHMQMLHDFLSHILTDQTRLPGLLEKGDQLNVESTAHRMKGSSKMMGAKELAEACAVIEQKAHDGDMVGAKAARAALDEAISQLEVFLAKAGEISNARQ